MSKQSSKSTGLIPLSEISPFLILTVFYVFANILCQSDRAKVGLLVLLLLSSLITLFHWMNPDDVPAPMKKLAAYGELIVKRIKIFPYELILVAGIVYVLLIHISRPFISHNSYHLASCILLFSAFLLAAMGNRARDTGVSGWGSIWGLFLRPLLHFQLIQRDDGPGGYTSRSVLMPNPTDFGGVDGDLSTEMGLTDETVLSAVDATIQEIPLSELEKGQSNRWTAWMMEEMERLSGTSKSDRS